LMQVAATGSPTPQAACTCSARRSSSATCRASTSVPTDQSSAWPAPADTPAVTRRQPHTPEIRDNRRGRYFPKAITRRRIAVQRRSLRFHPSRAKHPPGRRTPAQCPGSLLDHAAPGAIACCKQDNRASDLRGLAFDACHSSSSHLRIDSPASPLCAAAVTSSCRNRLTNENLSGSSIIDSRIDDGATTVESANERHRSLLNGRLSKRSRFPPPLSRTRSPTSQLASVPLCTLTTRDRAPRCAKSSQQASKFAGRTSHHGNG
jgi:hypothetical protein